MNDSNGRLSFKVICDGVQVNGTLVAKRMEHIESIRISLLVPPNQVNPSGKISADVVAFQCLSIESNEEQ
jgi:hypothetical protein